jgi:outer membrane receptor protein involved in Fe transport
MSSNFNVRQAVKLALLVSATPAVMSTAYAQDTAGASGLDEIVVTGTRITTPGVVSSSPITSIGVEEITFQQSPEVQKSLVTLPGIQVADNSAVNNGTAGVATISLRGLGAQRNLIMIDGKRVTPYNADGIVDTSVIPTALIERIDIVTGGASAVYGSDAISGAINFVMKKNFEGVAIDSTFSQTGKGDGDTSGVSLTMGANFADGRGNAVATFNYANREGVQLGARPLGQLGIETATGANYQNFLNGIAPTPAPAGCGGDNSVAAGGSTTTLPTRVAIAGGPGLGQFREDGTLGANCSVFNFNPYNYYQTPQKRYGGMVIANLELNEHADVYTRIGFGSTNVKQQVAPSGIFGSPFWTPLANPFIGAQARTAILAAANTGRTAGTVLTTGAGANWRDLNSNGVVDAADDLRIVYRRRTVELGARSTEYDNFNWQFLTGVRGAAFADWDYDVSWQYGESRRNNVSAGYTNVANIENAVNAVSTTACRTGGTACVPINLFGGQGTITPAMAAYASATAIEKQNYSQQVASASLTGPINAIQLPTAGSPLALSFGVEYREEKGSNLPDECLKLAPASCLGGAGGNTLPLSGNYNVKEGFAEAILPILNDKPFFNKLDLEVGYRYSDYSSTGTDSTYKYGFAWKPVDSLMFRVMKQRATRAPNIGELAAPQVASLQNALLDPCSVANARNITAALRALCIGTGMTNAQVGTVEDIVSGQVNSFSGTDLQNLPNNEKADTLTVGLVWTPAVDFVKSPIISIDYYDIDIKDVIGEFAPQEILDACYKSGNAAECGKIRRVAGTLTLPGSGIETFTTNLEYLRAEGIELGFGFGVGLGAAGELRFQGNYNHYLTNESLSSSTVPVLDCLGFYGSSCGNPIPEDRWVVRTTWAYDNFQVSALWRHLGASKIEEAQLPVFSEFDSIESYDYVDLFASWDIMKQVSLSLSVQNVLDKDPPVLGNEAATTSANSGNTLPSFYDTLGRIYAVGLNVRF